MSVMWKSFSPFVQSLIHIKAVPLRPLTLTTSLCASISSKVEQELKVKRKMPITILSGFLGSGKTTFLQRMIEGEENTKNRFGLVINDMASVNVDAKQIRQQTIGALDGIDTMELANGCVCCTLAEDLMVSVGRLVSLAKSKGTNYDHILVECSGIAEPRAIRDLFHEAEDSFSPLMDHVRLDTLITVVDGSVFLENFGKDTDLQSKMDLAFNENDPSRHEMIASGTGDRKITELLLEQVECADVVIINKCDLLANPTDVSLVERVISSVNPGARLVSCIRGAVKDPLSVIGSARGEGMVSWGVLDEHRRMISAAEKDQKSSTSETSKESSHNQDHGLSPAEDCNDSSCTDHLHSHSHGHSHSHENAKVEAECSDATCSDPTHDHNHSHSHSNSHGITTAQERFGITSFVYKRRRPFHPLRFTRFLNDIGKLSIDGVSQISSELLSDSSDVLRKARKSLLRSKGFVWMGSSGAAAYFMSHAGQFLELGVMGRWWADIPKAEWPTDLETEILVDFAGDFGDRRQELVFIGQFDQEENAFQNSQKALENVLDFCLLNDEEMELYKTSYEQGGDKALRKAFVDIN